MNGHPQDTSLINIPTTTVPSSQNTSNAILSHELLADIECKQLQTALANRTTMLTSILLYLNILSTHMSGTQV